MSSYVLPIDLSGSVSLNPSFTEGNITCITLELYFTFELSADAKTEHLRLHLIGVIWLFLVIRYINKCVVLPFTN